MPQTSNDSLSPCFDRMEVNRIWKPRYAGRTPLSSCTRSPTSVPLTNAVALGSSSATTNDGENIWLVNTKHQLMGFLTEMSKVCQSDSAFSLFVIIPFHFVGRTCLEIRDNFLPSSTDLSVASLFSKRPCAVEKLFFIQFDYT